MKRLLSMLLFVAAIFGLIGQETGFARVMSIESPVQASDSDMSEECAEMMGLAKPKPQPDKQPCKGMTPDCVAKMGCAVTLALIPPAMVTQPIQLHASAPSQSPVVRLIGRNTGPEPDPPTHLG